MECSLDPLEVSPRSLTEITSIEYLVPGARPRSVYWVGHTSSSHLIVFCTKESGFSERDIGFSESETSEVKEVKLK